MGLLKKLKKSIKKIGSSVSDAIGIDEDDFLISLGGGILGKEALKGLDRLTGRDIAEEQLEMQKKAVEEAERRAARNLADQREAARRSDVSASQKAAVSRRVGRRFGRRRGGVLGGTSNPLGGTGDLLGL